MNAPLFADTAAVHLQGEVALLCVGTEAQCTQYKINGFREIQILLTDHRESGSLAYKEWLRTGDMERFLSQMNTPAFVLVSPAGERGWTIDLYDTRDFSPINTLSIGVQAAAPLFIHNYAFYHEEPAGREGYNILAVYQNDPEPVMAFSFAPMYY